MRFRCPDARVVGKAYLKDWKLVFKFHADIEPCRGCRVPVLIWEISERDERRLDRYEGYPDYYVKKDLEVMMMDTGKSIVAMAYVMTAERKELAPPASSYFRIIEEGYMAFDFDTSILSRAEKESHR